MKGTPAIYLGRIVEKKHFRTFVYGPNGEKKLVESWDAYEAAMQSGIWFATVEDAEDSKAPVEVENEKIKSKLRASSKPKPKYKSKAAKVEEEEVVDLVEDDGMVFEITDENR